MAGEEDTVTDPENMYVVKFLFGGYELHSVYSWDVFEEADSREEMDLKLAARGMEADWSRCHAGTQYPARRMQ